MSDGNPRPRATPTGAAPLAGDGIVTPMDAIRPSRAVAFIADGVAWTFEQLAFEVDRLAAGMITFGVEPGDRVCLHLRNGAEAAIAYYACFRVGAVAVPMNLRHTPFELESTLRRVRPVLYLGHVDLYCGIEQVDIAVLDAKARFVVGEVGHGRARPWGRLLGNAANAPAAGGADIDATAVLLATSGTTGVAKFVAHSLGTLTHMTSRFGHLGFLSGQIIAFVMPMMHVSGMSVFFSAMRLGILAVFTNAAHASAVLATIEEHRCTALVGVPATMAQLIDCQQREPRDVSSLQWCVAVGDAPPAGLQESFRSVFGVPLNSFWASTEGATSLSCGLQLGAVSRLAPGVELRLVDAHDVQVEQGQPGEMLLRGPHVMLGYWAGPGRLGGLEDGWYRTGDLMRQDDFGNLWFISRLKDLIVRGGSNISPVEVELVLAAHPAVRDVAVIGIPDATLGQRVMGFVCLKDDSDFGQLDNILDSAAARLAAYKLPERLVLVTDIPRNGLGKIDRKELRARLPGSTLKQAA